MGEYNFKSEEETPKSLKYKKQFANRMLNECDALKQLCTLFSEKIDEMSRVEQKGMNDANLILELELRMTCNILINFLIYNNDDENVIAQFTSLNQNVE
jgi:hypothetical protein